MRLDEVPPGPVYVDTNVWYMCLRSDRQYLAVVRSLLERVIKGEIVALVGVPVLDELFYRLLLARIREQEGQHPLTGLRQDPAGLVRRHAPPIRKAIEMLLRLPNVHLVGVETEDAYRFLHHASRYGLLPRDALHVAIMERLNVPAIASDDRDFDRVPGIQRHWIANAPLP